MMLLSESSQHNYLSIPQIPVGDPERLWLRTAYELLRRGTRVNERSIRTRLHELSLENKIPRDFEPWKIDERLIMSGGAVTLLGAWHLDRDEKLLSQADQLILTIKRITFSDETKEAVTAGELSDITGMPVERVALLLHLITPLGYFSAGFSYALGVPASVKLQLNHPDVIREYARYDGIGRLLEEFAVRQDPKRRNTIIDGVDKTAMADRRTLVERTWERIKNNRVAAIIIVGGTIIGAVVAWLTGVLAFVQQILGI